MRIYYKEISLLFTLINILFFVSSYCNAQSENNKILQNDAAKDKFWIIDTLIVEGNKKTKKSIITREINIYKNDTLYNKNKKKIFKKNENRIFNTNLFVSVNLNIDTINNLTALKIQVKERWYTFPQGIFELADRNFNEWWYERGRNLQRVSYGIKLFQNNVRGRDETLKLTFQHGFTPKYGVSYDIPYIDKNQKYGLNFWFNFSRNREKDYLLANHSREFLKTNRFIFRNFESGINLFTRKGFFLTHSMSLSFHHNKVKDTILALNQNYFASGTNLQRYLTFTYNITMDKRNRHQFAESGYKYFFEIKKLGLTPVSTLNMAVFKGEYAHYFDLGKKYFLAYRLNSRFSFPGNQPYVNRSGLGYSDNFVRGYELYAINGQHHLLFRTSLRKKFFSKTFDLRRYTPIKQFGLIPINLYLTFYNDIGYVHEPNPLTIDGRLNNSFMRGIGAGINLVTYYDSVIRFEYSFTKNWERGFFMHFRKDI